MLWFYIHSGWTAIGPYCAALFLWYLNSFSIKCNIVFFFLLLSVQLAWHVCFFSYLPIIYRHYIYVSLNQMLISRAHFSHLALTCFHCLSTQVWWFYGFVFYVLMSSLFFYCFYCLCVFLWSLVNKFPYGTIKALNLKCDVVDILSVTLCFSEKLYVRMLSFLQQIWAQMLARASLFFALCL